MTSIDLQFSHSSEEGRIMGIYAKGHHDKEEFWTRAAMEWTPSLATWPHSLGTEMPPLSFVVHTYYRNIPAGDGFFRLQQAEQSPGAYPVTVLQVHDYHAALAFPRFVALHRARALDHDHGCQCAPSDPCAWRERTHDPSVDHTPRLVKTLERLGDQARKAWAYALEDPKPIYREAAMRLMSEVESHHSAEHV